jgi:hypothetical protein
MASSIKLVVTSDLPSTSELRVVGNCDRLGNWNADTAPAFSVAPSTTTGVSRFAIELDAAGERLLVRLTDRGLLSQ